jgi:hypothetical protein
MELDEMLILELNTFMGNGKDPDPDPEPNPYL